MIADTTFISDLLKERRRNVPGAATTLLQKHRDAIHTTIISAGELAVMFESSALAWEWLAKWKIYSLHQGVAQTAADIDRALKKSGRRLGENDNWIAGFAAYYREPIISHDEAFERAPGIRRIIYRRD